MSLTVAVFHHNSSLVHLSCLTCISLQSQLVPCTPFLSHLYQPSVTTRTLYTFPVSPVSAFSHNSSFVHLFCLTCISLQSQPSLVHLSSLTCSCFPPLLHLSCPTCICLPSLPVPCTASFSFYGLFLCKFHQ